VSLLANAALLIGAGWILSLFGNTYAEQAGWSLRILGLAAFPLIVKNHYVAICRIRGRVARVALFVAAGGLLELTSAALGARADGLSGLSLGWLAAICCEALFMASTVYKAAALPDESRLQPSNGVPLSSINKPKA
jgi:hypothetical protein